MVLGFRPEQIPSMKALLINQSYTAGGAARYVRDLHHRLPEQGVQTRVWIADAPDETGAAGVEVLRAPWERRLYPLELLPRWSDWRHRGTIRAFDSLRPGDADVVHFNLLSGGWCSLFAAGRLMRRMPSVWMHHDEWAATGGIACLLEGKATFAEALAASPRFNRLLRVSPYHASYKSRSLARLIDAAGLRPTLHLCPSRHMARLIESSPRFAGQPVAVIPHGTALADHPAADLDRAAARQALNLPLDARVVLMVSVNVHDLHKGFHLAAPALAATHARTPLHVLILGHGAGDWQARLAPIPVTAGVARSDDDLARAYRAADVTLIPSLAESYSYVAIESLACQRPYVSFDVGGPAELSAGGRHALVARCFDPLDLAGQLNALLNDPAQCHALGLAGRQWVRQEATLARMISRTRACYQQAIDAQLAAARGGDRAKV
jgi:glycosyltransferase involved in cell wall biosynthesis